MTRHHKRRRLFGVLGAVAVVAVTMAWPVGGRAGAAAPATVTLVGQGTSDVQAENASWEDGLGSATGGAVNDVYTTGSDGQGQTALATGVPDKPDYIMSGVPFPPGTLPGGDSSVVAAPILPSGLAFLLNPPLGGFDVQGSDAQGNPTSTAYGPLNSDLDPLVPGQTDLGPGCGTPSTLEGCPQVNIPADNLAEMVSQSASAPSGPDHLPLNYWGSSTIISNWKNFAYDPATEALVPPLSDAGGTVVYLRNDKSDDNYYLESWFSQLVKDTADPTLLDPSEQLAPSEQVRSTEWGFTDVEQDLPTGYHGTASPPAEGLTALLQLGPGWAYVGGSGQSANGGAIAETPPSGQYLVSQELAVQHLKVTQRTANLTWPVAEDIGVPNANGDYVTPTPSAVEAGVDAGAQAGESACSATDTNALYAMNHVVPGAYPLTWVDCMYVPAQGLSVQKADAIAGLIRYLVTDGQSALHPVGDGVLPQTYVSQALTAANTVVTDNCPGAGGQVVLTATPTADSPTSPGVKALGAVDECEPIPTTGPGASTTLPGASATAPPTAPLTSTPTTTPSAAPTTTSTRSPSSPNIAGHQTSLGGAPTGFGPGATGSGSSAASGATTTTTASSPTSAPAVVAAAPGSGPASGDAKPRRVDLVASIAANLPEPLGVFEPTIDKLSALLLGGLLFLGGRRLLRRIVKAWTS